MLVLEAYAWPGNVRELQSAIKYAYIQSAGEVITRDCLPGYLLGEPTDTTFAPAESESRVLDVASLLNNLIDAGESDVYERVISAVDRVVIEAVMRRARGSQVQASELLGISRTTLRAKLRSLGLAIEKQLLHE